MNRKIYITLFLSLSLFVGIASYSYADGFFFQNNKKEPLVNETETTGAFGANEAFTLEEDDISDLVIEKDLTDKVINEIEGKFESK